MVLQFYSAALADHFQAKGGTEAATANRQAAQFTAYALRAKELASKVNNMSSVLIQNNDSSTVACSEAVSQWPAALSQGKVEEAARLLKTAYELYHKGSETDAHDAAVSNKHALAWMCQQAGRHREAEALYLEVRCPREHLHAGSAAVGRRLHCMQSVPTIPVNGAVQTRALPTWQATL